MGTDLLPQDTTHTTVTFGGIPVTIASASDTVLIVQAPPHAVGFVDVVVTTSFGTATATGAFRYADVPTIASLSKPGAYIDPTGEPANVVITGTDLLATGLSGTTVKFGGVDAYVNFGSTNTSLSVQVPAHAAGAVSVVVTTEVGTATKSNRFNYWSAVAYAMTSHAGPGAEVVITGRGLAGASFVHWGQGPFYSLVEASVTSASESEVRLAVPRFLFSDTPTTVTLFASNRTSIPNIISGGFGMFLFDYDLPDPPTATSLTPTTGTTAGGARVTVAGTGFAPDTVVSIAGETCSDTAVTGTTSIVCTTPAHAAGSANLVVTNPDGQTRTLVAAYSYEAPPPPPATHEGLAYTDDGTSVTIIGCDGTCPTTLLIPSMINDHKVTEIAPSAFSGTDSLTAVTIGDGVTIGDHAFFSASVLRTATIGSGATIGEYSFAWADSLTTVTIGADVIGIGKHAFVTTLAFTSLYFQGSPPDSLGESPLLGTQATVYYLPTATGWESTFSGRPTVQSPGIISVDVSGTDSVGHTLTASPVGLSGVTTPTVTYQWLSANTVDGAYEPIADADSAEYSLVAGDAGRFLKVKATATLGKDSDTTTSSATNSIASTPAIGTASVSGAARVGQRLTAGTAGVSGLPQPTESFRWLGATSVDGTYSDLPDANSNTYVVTSDDVGRFLKVIATVHNRAGDASATSGAIKVEASDLPPVKHTMSAGATKVVVSRSAVRLTTPVSVSGHGRITQQATTSIKVRGKTVTTTRCRIARSTPSAGPYAVVCSIDKVGRASLRKTAMILTVRTTFTPQGGKPIVRTSLLKLARRR